MTDRYDRPRPAETPPPSLFDAADPPVVVPTINVVNLGDAATIQQAFEAFHQANPWVYDALVTLARDLVARGRDRIGIGMLFEVVRWQYARSTVDDRSEFRLNNNYRSRYARLIMANEPDLEGVFATRGLTAR